MARMRMMRFDEIDFGNMVVSIAVGIGGCCIENRIRGGV